MVITPFQLVDNRTFTSADIVGDSIFVSPEQANGVGNDRSTGIQVIVDYHDLQSAVPISALHAVVEGKSNRGQFYTIAYQFKEFRSVGVQQRRQIIMSQDFAAVRPGIEEEIGIGGVVTDHVYRQHGIMPSIWRVRVGIRDPGSSFISVRMSIYGHRYNRLTLADSFRGILVDEDAPGTLVTTDVT